MVEKPDSKEKTNEEETLENVFFMQQIQNETIDEIKFLSGITKEIKKEIKNEKFSFLRNINRKQIVENSSLRTMHVFQDGADFYEETDEDRDTHLYSVPFKVPDFDMALAQKAREEFLKWCSAQNINPIFV